MPSKYSPYLRTANAASTRPSFIEGSYSTFPSVLNVAPLQTVWRTPAQTRRNRRRASSSATPGYDNLPRTCNSFILFRSYYYRTVAQSQALSLSSSSSDEFTPSIKQNDLSTEAAGVWKTMSDEEKAPFRAEAKRLKEEYTILRAMYSGPANSRGSTRSPTSSPVAAYAPFTSPTLSPDMAGPSPSFPYILVPPFPAFYPPNTGIDTQTFYELYNGYPQKEGPHLDMASPSCDFDILDYLQNHAMASDVDLGVAPSYIACEEPQMGFAFGGPGYPLPAFNFTQVGSDFV